MLHCAPWHRLHSANSVDPNQTSRSTASQLGLRCLRMSSKLVSSLKRVNVGLRARITYNNVLAMSILYLDKRHENKRNETYIPGIANQLIGTLITCAGSSDIH